MPMKKGEGVGKETAGSMPMPIKEGVEVAREATRICR